MMDTPQARLELAREGMELSVTFLLIRLKLKASNNRRTQRIKTQGRQIPAITQ